MTTRQINALQRLCERYKVPFIEDNYAPAYGLPEGYVAGWVGPIYVGVDPSGRISS
jgi:hypothetical protein